MSGHYYWILDTEIRQGKLEELKALMNEMVDATRANEPGTLNYEWTISEDDRFCTLYERFADSQAAIAHIRTFMKSFAPRFMGCLEPRKLVGHGQPSEELKKALLGMNAKFMKPFGGFSR
jgi:quinol monooxygenase YgiN